MHGRDRMRATVEDIAELLGEDVDETILERIANTGASIDEVNEAIEDLEYERRYGEPREPSSARVEEVRAILEEIPELEPEGIAASGEDEQEETDEGLTVIGPEDLSSELP